MWGGALRDDTKNGCVGDYNPGQKSWDTFAKTPQIRAFPLHPQCNVDLKGSSHPESLQALSTLLGVGGGEGSDQNSVI